jgi:hypothetical protein
MTVLKSALIKGVMALAAGVALTTAAAAPASAAVVCNQWHECWRAGEGYTYPNGFGIVVHGDDWRVHHRNDYRWRHDRDDRGYYRNGVWITF